MIKTLAVHIKGYIKESVATPLFMVLEVIMETIIPLLMASMIDNGINKGNMEHIIKTGGLMLLCAFVALFAGAMGGIYGAKASAGFARNLRSAIERHGVKRGYSNSRTCEIGLSHHSGIPYRSLVYLLNETLIDL